MSKKYIKFHPTKEIQDITNPLEETIHKFANIINSFLINPRKYESDVTIAHYMKLLMNNIEGVVCIANVDLSLLPSALITTRPIFELSIHITWLMLPDEYIDRENRLLAILHNEIAGRELCIRELISLNINESCINQRRDDVKEVQNYYNEIRRRLSDRYLKIEKNDKFQQLLRELEREKRYPLYRELSIGVHGKHSATWMYKCDTGIRSRDWYVPLLICWNTFCECAFRFLEIFNYDSNIFLTEDTKQNIEILLENLQKTDRDIC